MDDALPARTEDGSHARGARRLLGRLRHLMAGSGTVQERLDEIVRTIAATLEAEVCSVYVRRAGDILELYATFGLFPEAVHRTRLRIGEGLIGVIAASGRALSLSDAQSHPAFAYRPETGEEVYQSLMGVPVLRSGQVSGVVAVQNRSQRTYTDEEIEALETVAMVLAELIAGGSLVNPAELHPTDGNATLPHRLEGMRLASGVAIGQAVLHKPDIVIRQVVAEDPEAEAARLETAIADMQLAIDRLLEAPDIDGEHRDILETYRMFAEDRGWLGRIREAVDSGLTAEAAVQKVRGDTRLRMKQINDPYIRERLSDLEDLAGRLQNHLSGDMPPSVSGELPDEFVLVARTMGPAELLEYDRRRLKGLVLEEGSPSSHVAIVAHALDIPVIGRVKGALDQIQAGDLLVVDGDSAQVMIRPGEDIQQEIERRLGARRHRQEVYAKLRDLPARTLDGTMITLSMNAGLVLDLPELEATNADGIGLYRTELPFMVRSDFPSVTEQIGLYKGILDHAGGKPVVFRTLDIGGDKLLPYLPEMQEENPAMGWRAIRIALDRPSMLRHQLRALIHAAEGRSFSVMFPMVAEVAELNQAKHILALELQRARRRDMVVPSELKVGAMIEVPSLLFQLPTLCREVDFVSVGSNDLMQFLFARDRGNPRLAYRYDVLSPPVLAVLAEILEMTRRTQVPVSVCGGMAALPIEALVLIGMGFHSLSMPPNAIGPVKAMIRSTDLRPLRHFVAGLRHVADHSIRSKLQQYARDHGIVL
ncbi:MAG TPA: phosphoenolpyruvate--protein phosphotransferase [Stellaceae bacterium]|nr:phosphoenolpyruvate--protein phosphotransferase [Stellaceae bacterium]